MKRIAIAITLLVLGGATLGALFTSTDGANSAREQNAWSDPVPPPDMAELVTPLRERILASGILGLKEEELAALNVTEDAAPEEEGPPPFPQIVATSIVDETPQVSLRLPDGRIARFRIGDTLPGEWNILSISLESLTVSQEGRETVIAVFQPPSAG